MSSSRVTKIVVLPPSTAEDIFYTYNPILHGEHVKFIQEAHPETEYTYLFTDEKHSRCACQTRMSYIIGLLVLIGIGVGLYMFLFRKN